MKQHFLTNYHSHSHYCDGVEPPRAQVEAALAQGVRVLGFSSHGPVYFDNAWSMKVEKLEAYLSETRALQAEYADRLELYVGLEVDYLPSEDASKYGGPSTYAPKLDYTVGSVHYLDRNEIGAPWEIDGSSEKFMRGLVEVHGGDIQKVIRLYYGCIRQMIERDPPHIVGHLDKIKIHNIGNSLYDEEVPWYQAEIDQTLDAIAASGCVLEVNTRGVYKKNLTTYPSLSILQKARQRHIPIMVNSDSHAPSEITAELLPTYRQLSDLGFRTFRILTQGQWQDVAFDEQGLYL
ncbi:histidinol-phosphatase [Salmonirosea aquatica]|uniref:Histidinol-phosphatase n=1 Tax=Salmonirosea aquatica TaxID=2654236 RepID=A0A7C9FBB6_9BACT|nr:histidinol-phosphatase HisJ family protein [Cytophagaceae bacterium SJW1-29]